MILQRIAEHAERRPHARVHAEGQCLSYAQLLGLVARTAGDIPKGAHLAIACDNPLGYLVGLLASLCYGGVAVPISTAFLDSDRTVRLLRQCDVSIVLSDRLEGQSLPFPVIGLPDGEARSTSIPPGSREDRPALILQTSGTTADPKAPVLTGNAIGWNAQATADRLALTPQDTGLITLSLTHSFGLNVTLALLMAGASVVLARREVFMPGSFLHLVRNHGVTVAAMVASQMYTYISQSRSVQTNWPLKAVLYAGGSTPAGWVRRLMQLWPGTRFLQGYGLTEAGPRVSMHDARDEPAPLESAGRPLPGTSVAVWHEGRLVAESGTVGEIWVRTPSRMLGYYRNEEATRQVFNGDWLRTGDLGYMDEYGYLYIRGRLKSLIKVGGRSVYPEEVEQVLLELNGVKACRAYGVLDVGLGEVVAVEVVGDDLDQETVRAHCKKWLEAYKIPRMLKWVAEIPRTEHGKIRRT